MIGPTRTPEIWDLAAKEPFGCLSFPRWGKTWQVETQKVWSRSVRLGISSREDLNVRDDRNFMAQRDRGGLDVYDVHAIFFLSTVIALVLLCNYLTQEMSFTIRDLYYKTNFCPTIPPATISVHKN